MVTFRPKKVLVSGTAVGTGRDNYCKDKRRKMCYEREEVRKIDVWWGIVWRVVYLDM